MTPPPGLRKTRQKSSDSSMARRSLLSTGLLTTRFSISCIDSCSRSCYNSCYSGHLVLFVLYSSSLPGDLTTAWPHSPSTTLSPPFLSLWISYWTLRWSCAHKYDPAENSTSPSVPIQTSVLPLTPSFLQVEEYNEHWVPFYLLCTPCHLNYTLVAKTETIEEDSRLGEQHWKYEELHLCAGTSWRCSSREG